MMGDVWCIRLKQGQGEIGKEGGREGGKSEVRCGGSQKREEKREDIRLPMLMRITIERGRVGRI